jgi:hypothetical protein
MITRSIRRIRHESFSTAKDIEQLQCLVEWLDGWRERRQFAMNPGSVHHGGNVTPLHKPNFGSA